MQAGRLAACLIHDDLALYGAVDQLDGVGAAAVDGQIAVNSNIGKGDLAVAHGVGDGDILIGAAGNGLALSDGQIRGGWRRVASAATTTGAVAGAWPGLFSGGVSRTGGNGFSVDLRAGGGLAHKDVHALGDVLHGDLVRHDQNQAVRVLRVHGGIVLVGVDRDGAVKNNDNRGAIDVALGRQGTVARALDDAAFHHGGDIACGVVAYLIRVGVSREVGVFFRLNAQSAAQHGHGLLAGNGIVGHGLAVRAEHDACGIATVDAVGVPRVFRHVGKARTFRLGQSQQAGEDGRHLGAGQVVVGAELAVAALNDAVVAPTLDGAFGPVAFGIAESAFGGKS